MTKQKFEVIKGGLNTPPHISKMHFISAYITDTRLMGVVGLYIHWEVTYADSPLPNDLHQFFYFESEEFGLEEYHSLLGNNPAAVSRLEESLFACLGGLPIDITEREAVYFLQTFVSYNQENKLPLPEEGREEYMFLMEPRLQLSAKERSVAMSKMCTKIKNENQAIHYFLMRVFGKDFNAASHLIKGNVFLNLYDELPISSLCYNAIDTHEDSEGNISYMAESVIDCADHYRLVVSELTLNQSKKITGFKRHSSFKISPIEAGMKFRRPEYVTIYELSVSPSRFETDFGDFIVGATTSVQEDGKIYMLMNPHNEHVKDPIFKIGSDVFGVYYVSIFRQLIVASYNIEDIYIMEHELERSPLGKHLKALARFEFQEPLLYEFVNSDFDSFFDFLGFIHDEMQAQEEKKKGTSKGTLHTPFKSGENVSFDKLFSDLEDKLKEFEDEFDDLDDLTDEELKYLLEEEDDDDFDEFFGEDDEEDKNDDDDL